MKIKDLTWKKLIIFACISGIYTAIMALIPITKDTSFRDIATTFEVWILFGIFIIMTSKSPKESALKCFVFFLISQPLVYIIQDIITHSSLLKTYYLYWFIWTVLTIPMGYIGYYLKKDKWYGLLILTPILILLGFHSYGFLKETISFFPNHLLSFLFCIITMVLYPYFIFKDKKLKIIGISISVVIIIISTLFVILGGNSTYNTTILSSGNNITFDNTYKVYLEDESYGSVYIIFNDDIDDYLVEAEFKRVGKTNFIIESPEGEKYIYELTIERYSYHLEKKN